MRFRDLPWQFLALWFYSLILGFVFMLAAYGTTAQWSTIIYEVVIFIFGAVLLLLKYIFFRNRQAPFEFSKNVPAYGYTLAFFLIPVMYFLAQGIDDLVTGQFSVQSWLPEVFTHFFALSAIPQILSPLGQVGVWLQEFALQASLVSPAEELFKTASLFGILTIIVWRREAKSGKAESLGFWTILIVVTLVNTLWVAMHGILEYHQFSDFMIAFVDGEILLAPTWFFGNPFPSVITHTDWNTFGTLGVLTTNVMLVMAAIFGSLTVFLWVRNRRSKKRARS